ncbi:SDR family oxidoreductase [Vibrio brasiliensis]|uniref:NAD(P)-dependent oxidoreductase n=1 Tax=Vibrio brasiliensis TaxID=170652 RepID=UPI001EFE08FB|nr:NAD(P)-binding oxidoreductase [Vibrio brasiliensis]MCG9782544.1 SDR family oxidoreductase [Vibrio brasiliensis]
MGLAMKVMVLGATGATGHLVVKQLLNAECDVVALVRNTEVLAEHPRLNQINNTALSLESQHLQRLISDCDAVISCLGHNMTLQGVYGAPRMLVTNSLQRVISLTSRQRERPLKLVLMSSAGVRNLVLQERVEQSEKWLNLLLRWILPPHRDNEKAAKLLNRNSTSHNSLEWTIVRPDTLIDQSQVSDYQWHQSPTRSALFNAGETSRINVANALCRLVLDDDLWQQWRGQMPVIYNA